MSEADDFKQAAAVAEAAAAKVRGEYLLMILMLIRSTRTISVVLVFLFLVFSRGFRLEESAGEGGAWMDAVCEKG